MRRVGEYPLWIGTARDARDLRAVLDAGIEAIVDLAMDEPPVHPTRELVYLRFPLIDGDGNPPWLLRLAVDSVERLIRERTPTLVACSVGMSRSPAVVAMALAKATGRSAWLIIDSWSSKGPLDLSKGLWSGILNRMAGATRIDRERAIAIAHEFLARENCRVVASVADEPRVDGVRIVEFAGCIFVDDGAPRWSVTYIAQLPEEVECMDPAGPIVTVDAETGEPQFFPAL
jgi:hypothetical protein